MSCLSMSEIQASLRSANFGGVDFYVDSTSEDYGVRAVVHEFPNANQHYTETLGRKARKISIEGYFVGQDWLSARDAMIIVAESGKPHTLRHPFYQQFKVATLLSFNVKEAKSELGMVRFSMDLVEELSVDILRPVRFLRHLVQSELDALIATAADVFMDGLDVRLFDDFVRQTGISGIQGWAEAIDGARVITEVTNGAVVSAAIESLHSSAADIIDGKKAIGPLLTAVTDGFREAVSDLNSASDALGGLIYDGVGLVASASRSPSVRAARALEMQVDKVFRRATGGLWSELLVSQEHRSQPDAIEARNELVRWFDSEYASIDPTAEPQVLESFDRLRSRVSTDMEYRWSDSAPVLDISLRQPVSAVALATRLYADPDRATELWERNPSPSMSFIGPNIRALAR
jgi:hypothetical protein